MGGGQGDPAVLLEEGGDLDEVAEGFVVPHAAVALEEHHGRGLLGRVVPGELGLADLGPLSHALEAGSEALLLSGADVVELPDDDFVFRGGQRGEGEKAE